MTLSIKFYQHDLILLPQGAILWPKINALILSDVHLGKSTIFQHHGIAIPNGSHDHDLGIINQLMTEHQLETMIVVGDLIHAPLTQFQQNEQLIKLIETIPCQKRILVKGNHDRATIKVGLFEEHDDYEQDGLYFSHHPIDNASIPSIIGHVHPYVSLKINRSKLRCRCFYQRNNQLILPAFGEFTGGVNLPIKDAEKIYALANSAVIPFEYGLDT